MDVPERTVLFLLSSDGLKSRIVLNHLLGDDWFFNHFDVAAIINKRQGSVPETLNDSGINYRVVQTVDSPTEMVHELFPEDPDYLISCGWGHYIPEETINLASVEAMNCHSSYLPNYRGPNAYRAIWANGCETGGASVHVLTEEFDDGKILCRERFDIAPFDTPREIAYKASELTAVLIREAILLAESGSEGVENRDGSYYGKIGWSTTIAHGVVNNLLRAGNVNWRWEIPPR